MKAEMILYYIEKSQRRRLIYPILLLIAVLFLLSRTSTVSYLRMETLPPDEPITYRTAQSSMFINAPVTTLYYTGEDYWSGGQLTGHFYYALLDDSCQYYVLKASAGRPADPELENYTVTGRIDPFGDELHDLNARMANKLNWTASGVDAMSSAFFINETVYLTRREIFLIVLLAAVLAATLAVLARTVIFSCNPRLTPAFQRLRKYGDPEALLADAERQLRKRSLIRTRDMVLTRDYLIEFSEDVSAIIPLESVLWTYDHASLRYTLKGKRLSYTIHVVTVHGDEFNLKQKTAEDVQVIYHELTTRYPNYFYGYSREHQQMVRHIIKELKEEE